VHRRGGNDQRRIAVRRPDDDVTTFTLGLPRWPLLVRLRGGGPLVRTIDRIEALVVAMAVVVSLIAVPIAGAVGTALFDSKRMVYSEQADASTRVVATITAIPPTTDGPQSASVVLPARWSVDGTVHTGLVAADSWSDIGDPVEIWVDHHGNQVPAPATTTRAAAEAVTVAVLIWLGVSGIAAALTVTTRVLGDRRRIARWQRGLDRLLEQSDGQGRSRTQ
jgi:hypothetical protein